MDPICLDDKKEDIEVKSAGGFLTSDVSGMEDEDESGEQEVGPRVGDEYQAELPPLITAPYLSQLVKKKRDSETALNMPESFSLGLPLPLMWSHCEYERSYGCEALESIASGKRRVMCEGKNVGGFSNFKPSYRNDRTDIHSELKTGLDQPKGKYLLPELLCGQSWTDIEYNSFLLGLYAFGKNLNLLKRFVGTKSMGDILFFYYGKFYKSKGYSRWSECRKSRTRRCIVGEKIFTGWRQQELLSRLCSHVAHDCQNTLIEISRNFGDGTLPFEQYVFALKKAVGLNFLTAAVGIGKGKRDLTGTALEPPKTNHVVSVRHEVPTGKACSSLASADIIKILTGDFRLSKARSSDLFWEAVWPRLLANGWHSEEPKDNFVSGTKQFLVFLVPGVKKFSRRKLEKGKQYFDSISDVLNKVASDPRLLETEIQATEGSVDMDNRQNKQILDGVSNTHQCPSLQTNTLNPNGSECKRDLMKFTIVDTSMVHDNDQRKVRRMRSLPFQPVSSATIQSCSSSNSETTTLEDSEDEIEQTNAKTPIEDQVDRANSLHRVEDQVEQANSLHRAEDQFEQANSLHRAEDQVALANSSHRVVEHQVELANSSHHVEHANSSYHVEHQVEQANSYKNVEEISDKGVRVDSSDHTRTPKVLNTTEVDVENHKFHFDLNGDEHSREMMENELPSIKYMTSDSTECFPCTSKMQELKACNHRGFNRSSENTSMDRMFDLNEPFLPSNLHEASEGMDLSGGLETLSFPSYLAKDNPNMSNEGIVPENHQDGEVSAKKSETRMLIDLNFPPDLALEMEIPSSKAIQQNDDQCAHTLSSSSETTQFHGIREFPDLNEEPQPVIVNRRQSTRNRPLTTKALEAIEYGFLNSKRKRKMTESSDNNSKSQCLRDETMNSFTCDNDNSIGNSIADTSANEETVIREYNFIV